MHDAPQRSYTIREPLVLISAAVLVIHAGCRDNTVLLLRPMMLLGYSHCKADDEKVIYMMRFPATLKSLAVDRGDNVRLQPTQDSERMSATAERREPGRGMTTS